MEKIINSRGLVDKGVESIHKKPPFAEMPLGGMTGRIDTRCRVQSETQRVCGKADGPHKRNPEKPGLTRGFIVHRSIYTWFQEQSAIREQESL